MVRRKKNPKNAWLTLKNTSYHKFKGRYKTPSSIMVAMSMFEDALAWQYITLKKPYTDNCKEVGLRTVRNITFSTFQPG